MPLIKGAYPDQLADNDVDPSILFNGKSLHSRLNDNGITSNVVLRNTYANSAYSKVSQADATVIPFSSLSDMVVLLRQQLSVTSNRSYFYVYWDALDHMSHTYAPHSDQCLAELNSLSHLLQTEFLEKIDQKTAENTVLLVTADHGHVRCIPRRQFT